MQRLIRGVQPIHRCLVSPLRWNCLLNPRVKKGNAGAKTGVTLFMLVAALARFFPAVASTQSNTAGLPAGPEQDKVESVS